VQNLDRFGIDIAMRQGMTNPPDFGPRSFAFACDVVKLYGRLIDVPRFPYTVARQLLRSATAIGANLEEARAPSSRRDLANRHAIALREARETKYWLRLIQATNLAPSVMLNAPLQEADELVAILTTSVRSLRDG
jgi:four helix bundle protein